MGSTGMSHVAVSLTGQFSFSSITPVVNAVVVVVLIVVVVVVGAVLVEVSSTVEVNSFSWMMNSSS